MDIKKNDVLKPAAAAENTGDYVSVSLNPNGTISVNMTQEQFASVINNLPVLERGGLDQNFALATNCTNKYAAYCQINWSCTVEGRLNFNDIRILTEKAARLEKLIAKDKLAAIVAARK